MRHERKLRGAKKHHSSNKHKSQLMQLYIQASNISLISKIRSFNVLLHLMLPSIIDLLTILSN